MDKNVTTALLSQITLNAKDFFLRYGLRTMLTDYVAWRVGRLEDTQIFDIFFKSKTDRGPEPVYVHIRVETTLFDAFSQEGIQRAIQIKKLSEQDVLLAFASDTMPLSQILQCSTLVAKESPIGQWIKEEYHAIWRLFSGDTMPKQEETKEEPEHDH